MKRRLLNFLTLWSLLWFCAAAALWVRSHFWADAAGFRDRRQGYFHASSNRGRVLFTHLGEYRGESGVLLGYRGHVTQQERDDRPTHPIGNYWHGFQFFRQPNRTNSTMVDYSGVALPHWFLAALGLPLPLYRFAPRFLTGLRERRRASSGRCPACGYDLRATPGRCPECGTPAAASTG
jgi:hypothetical protein